MPYLTLTTATKCQNWSDAPLSWTVLFLFEFVTETAFISFAEGDADADKKEKVEDVENAEPVAS